MKIAKPGGKLVAAALVALVVAETLGTQSSFAQIYPSKPVRMIVPYPRGRCTGSRRRGWGWGGDGAQPPGLWHRVLRSLAVALMLAATLGTQSSFAQTYPSKPVRMIVPYPPGGATDILARVIGQKLGESLGQQIVVENRPGATGNIGAEVAAKAPTDGYTLLMGQASNLAINISLMGKLPYDPIKDFAPVTLVASTPNVLVVHPSLPVRSIKDLIALAKAKPRAINYASSGNGSPGHLAAELFKKMAGIDMVHIPYKGAAPALNDVVAGQASLYFTSPLSAQSFVRAGRLRMIAVTSAKRSASMPDVPTIAEAGFREFDMTSWWGVLAPAGVSREIIGRLHGEIARILGTKDMKERLAGQGADAVSCTPEEFGAYIKSEISKWARVIKDSGARVD
jgi:tripartite-type tricarboxylate transporter receptor subunit TctC